MCKVAITEIESKIGGEKFNIKSLLSNLKKQVLERVGELLPIKAGIKKTLLT